MPGDGSAVGPDGRPDGLGTSFFCRTTGRTHRLGTQQTSLVGLFLAGDLCLSRSL